jgi:hypothetical protein
MEERKPDGTFAKGWKGGPGRPRRDTEEKYLRAFRLAVKAGDWREVIERALIQAKTGDKDARKFLADYLVGRPTEYVAADLTSGGEPLQQMTDDELVSAISRIVAKAGAGETGEPCACGEIPMDAPGAS